METGVSSIVFGGHMPPKDLDNLYNSILGKTPEFHRQNKPPFYRETKSTGEAESFRKEKDYATVWSKKQRGKNRKGKRSSWLNASSDSYCPATSSGGRLSQFLASMGKPCGPICRSQNPGIHSYTCQHWTSLYSARCSESILQKKWELRCTLKCG